MADTKIEFKKFFLPGLVVLAGMTFRAFLEKKDGNSDNIVKLVGKQLDVPIAVATLATADGVFNFLGDERTDNFNIENLIPTVAGAAAAILGFMKDPVGYSIEAVYGILIAIKKFKTVNFQKLIKE